MQGISRIHNNLRKPYATSRANSILKQSYTNPTKQLSIQTNSKRRKRRPRLQRKISSKYTAIKTVLHLEGLNR
jgi:hypothetical protein